MTVNRRYPVSGTGQPVSIEYKCDAIVDDDSREFARKMQESLNASTNDGFVMQTMIGRELDHGLVIVYQKATLLGNEQQGGVGDETPHPAAFTPGTRH
jgi:hypothetical protein